MVRYMYAIIVMRLRDRVKGKRKNGAESPQTSFWTLPETRSGASGTAFPCCKSRWIWYHMRIAALGMDVMKASSFPEGKEGARVIFI